ncbi:MAG: hypothetical protein Q4B70_00605 [Lachnospiraceae bacterium]|nr:hypothetical protein [Lachnospiraceae bacterium]
MIDQEKLVTMTQLALYEKKKGQVDLLVYSYRREDFVRFQGLKTMIAATVAFILIVGFIAAWNIDVVIANFDTYNYTKIGAALLAAYIVFLVFFTRITSSQSKELYNQARPRVRRYYRSLNRLEKFYDKEEKMQKEFEKGEWRDGK